MVASREPGWENHKQRGGIFVMVSSQVVGKVVGKLVDVPGRGRPIRGG